MSNSLQKSALEQVRFGGYKPVYCGAETKCPGCGRSHWHVGRTLAECAFCATAMPMPESEIGRSATIIFSNRFGQGANRGAFTINGQS